MRAPWLGDILRDAGLTVVNIGQPVGRGRDMDTIYGVVGHDTVTPPSWSPEQNDRLIRDGHSRVPGPLYQLGLDRQGRFRWAADGRCNHNGHGTWGNNSIGIGAYCNGGGSPNEPWNNAQRDAFIVGTRAILDYLGLGRSVYWNPRAAGHKETDPDRKTDPYGVNMANVRQAIAQRQEDNMAKLSDEAQEFYEAMYRDLKSKSARPTSLGHVLSWMRGFRKVLSKP